MNKLFLKLLFSLILAISGFQSKAQLAGWFFMYQDGNSAWQNRTGNEISANANKLDGRLANVPTLTRGSGLGITSNNTRTYNSIIKVISANPALGLTLQEAENGNVYYELVLQPKTGEQINIGHINFRYRRVGSTGPDQMIWKYYLGNVADVPDKTDFTAVGSAIPLQVTETGGTNAQLTGIGAVTALQNVGSTKKIVLRAYFYGSKNTSNSDANTAIAFGKSNQIGNTEPVPEYGALSIFDTNAPAVVFAPWDQVAWAGCYDADGRIINPFPIYTDVVFETRTTPWKPVLSPSFSASALIDVRGLGITVDGNSIEIDATSASLSQSLANMYTAGRPPWDAVREVSGINFTQQIQSGFAATTIKNLTIKGFHRGVRLGNPGTGTIGHEVVVQNCSLLRNVIGLYNNGNNATIKKNQIVENGFCGIYSGYRSHSNSFTQNIFRDNVLFQGQASYGDFVGDTYYNTNIVNNTFAKSLISNSSLSQIGISIFRNEGEDNVLRADIPHNNIIQNNSFDTYNIAIHVASRMGRKPNYDVTGEGRDYAFYNLIKQNQFKDCSVGIKINSEGNTIDGNIFTNTSYPIVLHAIFFKLKNTTINNQPNETAHIWYVKSDYSTVPNQAYLFNHHDNINGSIAKAEKRVEVFSTIGTPSFATPSGIDNNLFKLNPTPPTDILWNYRLGNPTVRKYGQFQLNLPGNEIAAIWNDKITRVNNVDYYSILIFDQNGIEINRSGLSTVGWSQLAVGYFTRTSGEMEIAVVPKTAIDGKYPVYIFRRGYKEPQQILYPDNTDASITISTDASHQLVVSFGVLPLKFLLLSAKADAMEKTVDLKWHTKNEVNTNGFVVERKVGDGNFVAIGNRTSNNNIQTNTYAFKDEKPVIGINYYRIKQLDVNGDFSYSEIVPAKIGANFGISIYPNPVEKLLNINHFEADTSATISVLSVDGKVLINHRVAIGLNFSSLDIVNLPKGTYTLVYTSQKEKSSVKFIKK
ncbi:hypothetical protein D3C87_178620 [compost metagenome]